MNVINFGKADKGFKPFWVDAHQNIVCESLKQARLTALTESELVINFYNDYDIHFVPVPEVALNKSEEELKSILVQNEWAITAKDSATVLLELDGLLKKQAMLDPDVNSVYSANKYWISESGDVQEKDALWSVRLIGGSPLLFVENMLDADNYRLLLLKEIAENGIVAVNFDHGKMEEVLLEKQPNLSTAAMENKEKLLVQTNWKIENYSIGDSFTSSVLDPFEEIDTMKVLNEGDFIQGSISYRFNKDKTFKIFKNKNCVTEGEWKLSKSGKILKTTELLSYEVNPVKKERYIFLLSLTENDLVFIKNEELHTALTSFQTSDVKQHYSTRR